MIGNLEARKEGDGRTKAEAGRVGGAVGIGVVERQATAEREALGGRGAEVRQAGILGGRQLEVTLLALVVLLLDADVMLDGIVAALAEGPGGLQRTKRADFFIA